MLKRIGIGLVGLLLASCAQVQQPQPFQLAVAHINDHHSHLVPRQRTAISYKGEDHRLQSGGFAAVAAAIEDIRNKHQHVLTLHAGDAITGTLFYTLFNGEADAALMNHVCFDAFALGNHEFDSGDKGLKTFLDFLAMSDCSTVVLGANVEPEVGVSPLTPKTRWDSFQPYTIFNVGGEKVGLIGLDIAIKTKNSSQPDATTTFADEYTTAAYYVAELQRLGVEKIGLLTHIQYRNDLTLAEKLPAIDFIVGGDSHTLLGDYARFGLPSVGPYPMQTVNLDGDPVCVVHAWEYSQVVGELVIDFNGDQVASCGGQSHLLLSPEAPHALAQLPQFWAKAGDSDVTELLSGYQVQLEELTMQVIADVPERLCLKRMGPVPAQCGPGTYSDAHRVVAEAFLASAPQADFALQNGGGVRNEIKSGRFTVADAYGLLPFSNTLVEVQISGAELHQVLEQALAYAVSAGGSDGAYPHGAGVRFAVDMKQPEGQRVSQLAVQNRRSKAWQPVQPEQTYIMITNSFLAGGNDGWKLLADLQAQGRVNDTYVNYAQSFVDWARAQQTIKRPSEHSTLSYQPVQ